MAVGDGIGSRGWLLSVRGPLAIRCHSLRHTIDTSKETRQWQIERGEQNEPRKTRHNALPTFQNLFGAFHPSRIPRSMRQVIGRK